MLSAARREDARRGLGSMEEGIELEEGEAYSSQEEDHCIDPDALSYIDEKIQDVLGHFQKDFEAGVSAENLGAKFGGYGSFLPTYQRSPSILCHPSSPNKVANQNVAKSSSNMSVEVTNQNTSVTLSSSFPKSNNAAVPLVDNSCKWDITMNKPNTQDPSSLQTPFSKTTNCSDNKTLKLRIKVGTHNSLARNNAAIYSGLGLDISPSPSSEESPDGSNGIFPELDNASDESPRTIIQVMTCFPIPGVHFLSPLQDCLFHSIEKDLSWNKPYKQGKLSKERSETTSGFIDFSIHSRESNGLLEKPTKLSQHNGRPRGAKSSEDKGAVILNRGIDIEAQPAQVLASTSSITMVSPNSKNTKKADGQIAENTVHTECKPLDHPMEIRKDLPKDNPITGPTKEKQFEVVDSTINNVVGYSVNRIVQSKRKSSEKTSMTERAFEDQNTNNQKNGKPDLQREGRVKVDKGSEISNTDSSGEKRRNEQVAEAKDQVPEKKRKVISSQSDFGEVVKDSVSGSSSAALNEKKKKIHGKGDHEEKSKAQKPLKCPSGSGAKESYGNSNWDIKAEEIGVGSSNNLKVKNKVMKHKHEESIVPFRPFKERTGGKKMGGTLSLCTSAGEPVSVPLTCNAPAADAPIAPQTPIVIEENWVQCDICQKWRLLPYGTNPGHLPSKWQCNLLNWLPGMNSCHFSEDDTTNALHALYVAPVSENVASLDGFPPAASTSLASGIHLGVPTTMKKKSYQKDALVLNQSTSTEFPNAVKKDDQVSVNANQNLPAEVNSSYKDTVSTLGRSTDFRTEKHKPKQKDKHKNHGFYSSGGIHSEKNEKHSKSKSKRIVDQDDLRSPKKHKKERLQSLEYDMQDNPTPSNKVRDDVQCLDNGQIKEHLSTSDIKKFLITKKKLLHQESQRNRKALATNQNEENRVNIKENFSQSVCVQVKKADLSVSEGKISKISNLNNRKDKKQTISRMLLVANGDYIPDEMDEEAINLVEKEHPSNHSQENAAFSRDLDFDSLKRDSSKRRGTNSVQPSLAANSSSSKVSGSQKSRSNIPEPKGSPVESVSSSPLRIPIMEKESSKKNSDKKYATNTDYSVLGSPKRCSGVEIHGENRPAAKCRKDNGFSFQKQSIEDHKAANSSNLDSLGGTIGYLEKGRTLSIVGKYDEKLLVKQSAHDKISPIENGDNPHKDDYQDIKKASRHHQMGDPLQRMSGKSASGIKEKHRGSKSDSDKSRLKASGSLSDNKDLNSANNPRSYRLATTTDSCRNEKDGTHDKCVKDCLLKKEHSSRWTTSKADNSLSFALQDHMDMNGNSVHPNQQRNVDSKNLVTGARSSKPEIQVAPLEHEKTVHQNGSHKTRIPDLHLSPGQEKSLFKLASGDKQETQARCVVSTPLKQHRSDGEMVDAVTTDALKVVRQQKHPDSHIGSHHTDTRHAISNGPDTSSPIRKENHTVLIKEARDLKHTANRLKIEGRELESTDLFFQAALKFLHIASLMESATFDSAKLAEAAQMYFETAKLCEFVAHECERIKEMASAALAYKCIEVAYLKAAYCKNPNASRDRHELQAAFQFHPPGESPSSSASDVDNLNNQALLGKNVSAKGVSSPQVAGNHILAARHHLQVMRLLHYTNDLNCAFEATRKIQISIAAASANLDKDRPASLSSVKKALDFNFHDVEGLLRLVRVSLESIGR